MKHERMLDSLHSRVNFFTHTYLPNAKGFGGHLGHPILFCLLRPWSAPLTYCIDYVWMAGILLFCTIHLRSIGDFCSTFATLALIGFSYLRRFQVAASSIAANLGKELCNNIFLFNTFDQRSVCIIFNASFPTR